MSRKRPGVLWLIGMMGSGKTSVGMALAERLGAIFVDTDVLIAGVSDRTIAELWEEKGEEVVRRLEADAIAGVASGARAVVATGGGAVLSDENVATMKSSGTLVWLRARPDTLSERLGDDPSRPLLATSDSPSAALERILAQRRSRYAQAADVVIDTDDLDVKSILDELEAVWNGS